jgi:hypothetical protein
MAVGRPFNFRSDFPAEFRFQSSAMARFAWAAFQLPAAASARGDRGFCLAGSRFSLSGSTVLSGAAISERAADGDDKRAESE